MVAEVTYCIARNCVYIAALVKLRASSFSRELENRSVILGYNLKNALEDNQNFHN